MKPYASKRGSSFVTVAIFAFIVLVGLAALFKVTKNGRQTAYAYSNKIQSHHLAEAGAYQAVAMLKEAASDAELALQEMTDAEFANYVVGDFSALVHGASGHRDLDLRSESDGNYRLVTMTRNPDGDVYTVRARGIFNDPVYNRDYQTEVELDVAFLFDEEKFGYAIISDMMPGGSGDGGKKLAQDGNVVFELDHTVTVVGGILANGGAYAESTGGELHEDNIGNSIRGEFESPVKTQQAGTPDQVPDYTNPGGDDQLFDFDRIIALSDAMHTEEAPTHFTSVDQFVQALYAGKTFKGVIVVDVDPADFVTVKAGKKGKPGTVKMEAVKLYEDGDKGSNSATKYYEVPAVQVEGTLVFNYPDRVILDGVDYGPPPPLHKVFMETGLHVNAPALTDVAAFDTAMTVYETELAVWKATDRSADPPKVPSAPSATRPLDRRDTPGQTPGIMTFLQVGVGSKTSLRETTSRRLRTITEFWTFTATPT